MFVPLSAPVGRAGKISTLLPSMASVPWLNVLLITSAQWCHRASVSTAVAASCTVPARYDRVLLFSTISIVVESPMAVANSDTESLALLLLRNQNSSV